MSKAHGMRDTSHHGHHEHEPRGPRRTGDAKFIDGGYQHRALEKGPAVQRFWHATKLGLLDWAFPVGPGQKVLDVGCGSGVFADLMATRGAEVLAIDANKDAIDYAQRHFRRPNLRFEAGLLDELPLAGVRFDRVTCVEVVEHVYIDQVRILLRDLQTRLAPGGRLLLTTPNYRGVWPVIEAAVDFAALFASSAGTSVARMDGEQHVCRFHRRLLRHELEKAGFVVERLRTFSTFAPFAAALSWGAARRLEAIERSVDLPFGSLLLAVAVRA